MDASARSRTQAEPGAGTMPGGVRATAFGLDVWSASALEMLDGTRAQATGRMLEIARHAGSGKLSLPVGAELLSDEREPGGAINFRIEHHPEAGYLIWGPRYGAHLISTDGRRLRCAPGTGGERALQRLLIAQALPWVAVLRGLEVFHSSAVVLDGHAVALLGPSGAGKTSVAVELCRRGGGFLADDVLALERDAERLIGHPGSPVAGVERAEAARTGAGSEASILGEDARERLVRMSAAAAPAPLAAMYFLDRRPDGPVRPCFEPLASAQSLLAATFNFVLATPERLLRLLDVCGLAAGLCVESVVLGPAVDASQLAIAIERRVSESREP